MTDLLLSLAAFAATSTLTPGGATTLATASGAQFGVRRSLPLIAGIAIGLAGVAALSSAGLGALLQAYPVLGFAMKLAGSAYLLWLAVQIARSGRPGSAAGRSEPIGFSQGVALLTVNPKAWAMSLGAAASFATLASGPIELAGILAAVFGAASSLSLCLWCVGGAVLARALKTDAQWRTVNVLFGALIAASIIPIWLG